MGLVVLDSVAANYRAEFEREGGRQGASLAKRGAQLAQVGALLRDLARTRCVAVVVANQVADRFSRPPSNTPSVPPSRTTSGLSQGPDGKATLQAMDNAQQPDVLSQEEALTLSPDPLALDHQQRWFTGWGDAKSDSEHTMKTPSLGLVWTNQIACRIALIKQPVFATRPLVVTVNGEDRWNDEEQHISRWRRWFKVAFAPWAPPSEGRGIEFELLKTGVRHVAEE